MWKNQSTKSGAEEQFLPLDCMAKARTVSLHFQAPASAKRLLRRWLLAPRSSDGVLAMRRRPGGFIGYGLAARRLTKVVLLKQEGPAKDKAKLASASVRQAVRKDLKKQL